MKNRLIQRISFQVKPSHYVKENGMCAFYLQLIIDRVPAILPLGICFYKSLFDQTKELFNSNTEHGAEIRDYNLIINQEKGKANDILARYRLQGRTLTHKLFKKDFSNYISRDSFTEYFERKNKELKLSGFISESTAGKHLLSLNRIKNFTENKNVLFTDLDKEWVSRFETHMRRKSKYAHNTIVSTLKELKTYINHAIADGYSIENPLKGVAMVFNPGNREVLEENEIISLRNLMKAGSLLDLEIEVLRKFLFSCYTGLRISDNKNVDTRNIDSEGTIEVKLKKGERYGKTVRIPLPTYAYDLVKSAKGKVFKEMPDTTVNEKLKVIAAKAGIEKNLTFHVARDTFGTTFIKLGGDVVSLKELMGHSKIETTMIYVKMSENRKKKLMDNFNTF